MSSVGHPGAANRQACVSDKNISENEQSKAQGNIRAVSGSCTQSSHQADAYDNPKPIARYDTVVLEVQSKLTKDGQTYRRELPGRIECSHEWKAITEQSEDKNADKKVSSRSCRRRLTQEIKISDLPGAKAGDTHFRSDGEKTKPPQAIGNKEVDGCTVNKSLGRPLGSIKESE